jgi:hypothetical protein
VPRHVLVSVCVCLSTRENPKGLQANVTAAAGHTQADSLTCARAPTIVSPSGRTPWPPHPRYITHNAPTHTDTDTDRITHPNRAMLPAQLPCAACQALAVVLGALYKSTKIRTSLFLSLSLSRRATVPLLLSWGAWACRPSEGARSSTCRRSHRAAASASSCACPPPPSPTHPAPPMQSR